MKSLWWLVRGYFRFQFWILATAIASLVFVTTIPLLGVYWRATVAPSHATFWDDLIQHETEVEKTYSEDQLALLYGPDAGAALNPQLGGIFSPSRPMGDLAALEVRAGEENPGKALVVLAALMLGFFVIGLGVLRNLHRFYATEENDEARYRYFSDSSREGWLAWAISVLIVCALSWHGAELDAAWGAAGVARWQLAAYLFGLSYTAGFWEFVIKDQVDAALLSSGRDPAETFTDDLITLAIMAPFLYLTGNGPLAMASALVAGLAPGLILKGLRKSKALVAWLERSEEPERMPSSLDFRLESFMAPICGLLAVGTFLMGFYLLWQFETQRAGRDGEAQLRAHAWEAYRQEAPDRLAVPAIADLIEAAEEPASLELRAALHAWRGEANAARELEERLRATARPFTNPSRTAFGRPAIDFARNAHWRNELLPRGHAPARVEQIVEILAHYTPEAAAARVGELEAMTMEQLKARDQELLAARKQRLQTARDGRSGS